jgi:glycosyltransferase involved in cell wall biosynthesis
MKLSVIIPCFNAASTIAVQLEALANQQWSDSWEIIVANNGSTDGSVAVVRQYQARLPHLRIVDASRRKGATYALNVGMRAATGDAFVFCDADDEIAPGWLAAMGNALRRCKFVAGQVEYQKLNSPQLVPNTDDKLLQTELAQFPHPPYLPYASSCNLGMRRSVYETVGDWNESLLYSYDTEYCWRAQLAGIELHFIPGAIVHYRLRDGLSHMYRQGRNWSEAHVFLRQKYGGPLNSFFVFKQFAKLALHLPRIFVQRPGTQDFGGWLWQFGWRVGTVQGCVKYLLLEQQKPLPTQRRREQVLSSPRAR